MSEPFLAEIRMIGFNFPPKGWADCDGQILPIAQNQSLYSLLGTTYGGDGRTSFGLPGFRGRAPMHRGDRNAVGAHSGVETITLTTAEIAAHTHTARASSSPGDNNRATGRVLGAESDIYGTPAASSATELRSGTVTSAGGGGAHDNMQPYLTIRFCIAMQGLFPSRN